MIEDLLRSMSTTSVTTASGNAPLPHHCLVLCNMDRHEVFDRVHLAAAKPIGSLSDNRVNVGRVDVLRGAVLQAAGQLRLRLPAGLPSQLRGCLRVVALEPGAEVCEEQLESLDGSSKLP